MANGNSSSKIPCLIKGELLGHSQTGLQNGSLHPAWLAFIRFCAQLEFGDIERLKIQDGLPLIAELTTKKVKFG